MAKYLFFNIPSTGHVDPTLPIAAELVRRGHHVDYFLTEAYRQQVQASGASYHPYQGVQFDYFEALSRRFNPVQLATLLVTTADGLLASLNRAVAELQPQVIVYNSMCPWGKVAAKQAGLPAVASMALLDLPQSYLVKSGEWLSAVPVMAAGLPWIPRYLRAASRLTKRTGVGLPNFIEVLNWPGDHNLCFTARDLLPEARRYGTDYDFVGPPGLFGAAQIPFPFEELDPGRPLIYISLGTVFNHNPHFFRACLEALAGSDYQVVLSTGNGVPVQSLAPIPENAIVRTYVPQEAILERASLYISHSGANSVQQALSHGVPVLLAPQQLEQALTAARIAELGAGLILNRRGVNPENIRRLVNRLFDEPAYRGRAAELGAALSQAGGADRAVDVLEAIAAAQPGLPARSGG